MIAHTAGPEKGSIHGPEPVKVAAKPACRVGVQEGLGHADDRVGEHLRVRGRLIASVDLGLDHLVDERDHARLDDAVGGRENPLRGLAFVLEESAKRLVIRERPQLTLEYDNEPLGSGSWLGALDPAEQRRDELDHRHSDHGVSGAVPPMNRGPRHAQLRADGLYVDPLSRQEALLDGVEHLLLGGRRRTAGPSLDAAVQHAENGIRGKGPHPGRREGDIDVGTSAVR